MVRVDTPVLWGYRNPTRGRTKQFAREGWSHFELTMLTMLWLGISWNPGKLQTFPEIGGCLHPLSACAPQKKSIDADNLGSAGFRVFFFSGGVHLQETNGCNDLSFNAPQVLMGPFSDSHHQDTLGRAEGKNPCVIVYPQISVTFAMSLQNHPGPSLTSLLQISPFSRTISVIPTSSKWMLGFV